jgi:acetyltransferase
VLRKGGIPVTDTPEQTAKLLANIIRHAQTQEMLYETPERAMDGQYSSAADGESARMRHDALAFLRDAQKEGRRILTEYEANRVLKAFGMPMLDVRVATSAQEAVAHAQAIGYPIVVKLHSTDPSFTHKEKVGGVKLNLTTDGAVRGAFEELKAKIPPGSFDGVTIQPFVTKRGLELFLGANADPICGPTLAWGFGGEGAEQMHDIELGFPPLNLQLARSLMRKTRVYRTLTERYGREAEQAVTELLIRFGTFNADAYELVKSAEINPLLVTKTGEIVSLDARIELHPAGSKPAKPLIHPYPKGMEVMRAIKDNNVILIRPIRAEDESLARMLQRELSEKTAEARYHGRMPPHCMNAGRTDTAERDCARCKNGSCRFSHCVLSQCCNIDYDQHMALVALTPDGDMVGEARAVRANGNGTAELGLVVRDSHQRQGIATVLIEEILKWAREKALRVVATTEFTNQPMVRTLKKYDFVVRYDPEDVTVVHAELPA